MIYIALNASFCFPKFTKISGGWGSAPEPTEGTYVPQTHGYWDFVTPFGFSQHPPWTTFLDKCLVFTVQNYVPSKKDLYVERTANFIPSFAFFLIRALIFTTQRLHLHLGFQEYFELVWCAPCICIKLSCPKPEVHNSNLTKQIRFEIIILGTCPSMNARPAERILILIRDLWSINWKIN